MYLKAGTILTGKIHKTVHGCVLAKGEMLVTTDDEPLHIKEGWTAIGYPGSKRAGYAITDCVFVNIFDTSITDIAELEAAMGCDTLEQYLEHAKTLELTWH